MSNPDPPPKPMPSPEEIQAYLDASSARTKKRLPLATIPNAEPEPAKTVSRPLPVAGANDKVKKS